MFLNKLNSEAKEAFLLLAHHVARSDKSFLPIQKELISGYLREMNVNDVDYNEESFSLSECLEKVKDKYFQKVILIELLAIVYTDNIMHSLEKEIIDEISSTYHTWQSDKEAYEDIAEYCYSASKDEVEKKDYSLVPSKYIEFVNRDENIDFDTKMTNLQSEFTQLLKDEEKSKQELLTVFKELGYEIKL